MPGRKNNRRFFLVSIFIFVLVASPVDFSFFSPIASVRGDTSISGVESWSNEKVVSGTIVVLPGAILTIEKGARIRFDDGARIEVGGKLSVEGTPEHPVVFRRNEGASGTYSVVSAASGVVSVRYADVSGGGSSGSAFIIGSGPRERTFFQGAQAFGMPFGGGFSMYSGAFKAVSGGALDIERTSFHDNAVAISTDSASYAKVKVWRSKFSGNTIDFVNDSGAGKSDIRYNWWGSGGGPDACVDACSYNQSYRTIIGNATVVPWATVEDRRDPVVVIPGIMGSWRKTQSSELELDPIFGAYDDLIELFDENGYEEGRDLFRFPYEWRMSNIETAKLLQAKVDAIKLQTKWPRVDIVAHSMGGLVVREYVRAFGGDASVDQLVTLGTPHEGAPKSYLQWEGGEFIGFSGFFAKKIFQQEAEENGYTSIFDYIRKAPIQSVRELLPVYPYLRNKDESELMSYSGPKYPLNPFLENLKTSAAVKKLAPILFTNIVGKTEHNETIEKIRVDGLSIELLGDSEKAVRWGHGKPDGYDAFFGGDRGLELGSGDGTVPSGSARGIVSDEVIEIRSSHGDLPSAAAGIVYRTFLGVDPPTETVKRTRSESLLLLQVFSPIDIQVVSPSGKRMGKKLRDRWNI